MIKSGNAGEGAARGGWLLGHFAEEPLQSEAVEIKWANHQAGVQREEWASGENVRTISILIRGRFALQFEGGQEVLLENEGDYAYWSEGVGHSWRCEQDSLIVTVRWPSKR